MTLVYRILATFMQTIPNPRLTKSSELCTSLLLATCDTDAQSSVGCKWCTNLLAKMALSSSRTVFRLCCSSFKMSAASTSSWNIWKIILAKILIRGHSLFMTGGENYLWRISTFSNWNLGMGEEILNFLTIFEGRVNILYSKLSLLSDLRFLQHIFCWHVLGGRLTNVA